MCARLHIGMCAPGMCTLTIKTRSSDNTFLGIGAKLLTLEKRIAPIFAGNDQGRASRIILNGVSAARRNLVNPASVTTCLKRRSPAWAPNPNATS